MLTDLQKRKLTKLFSMYDANCDGSLLLDDFEAIAKKLAGLRGWGARYPKYLNLVSQLTYDWKRIKAGADQDRDGAISLAEWLDYHDQVLSDKEQYSKRVRSLMELVFEVFDENGDEKISQKEWASLLSVYHISPVYAASIFKRLDANQDGFLTREEVLQLIHKFYFSDDPEAPANFMFGPY